MAKANQEESKARMRRHAKEMALKRFNLKFTKNIRKQVIKGIQTSRYKKVEYKGTCTRNTFIVDDIGKIPFKVVYSKTTKDIVTVMHLNSYEKLQWYDNQVSKIIKQI